MTNSTILDSLVNKIQRYRDVGKNVVVMHDLQASYSEVSSRSSTEEISKE